MSNEKLYLDRLKVITDRLETQSQVSQHAANEIRSETQKLRLVYTQLTGLNERIEKINQKINEICIHLNIYNCILDDDD